MHIKMTMFLAGAGRETISVETDVPGTTDEDILDQIVHRWVTALTHPSGLIPMKFKSHPGGEMMVFMPEAINGFSLKVESVH